MHDGKGKPAPTAVHVDIVALFSDGHLKQRKYNPRRLFKARADEKKRVRNERQLPKEPQLQGIELGVEAFALNIVLKGVHAGHK